jgi:hypothetical protein
LTSWAYYQLLKEESEILLYCITFNFFLTFLLLGLFGVTELHEMYSYRASDDGMLMNHELRRTRKEVMVTSPQNNVSGPTVEPGTSRIQSKSMNPRPGCCALLFISHFSVYLVEVMVKAKFPVSKHHLMNAKMESWRKGPHSLNLSTRGRWVVSFTFQPFYLRGHRTPCDHWMGLRAGLYTLVTKRKTVPGIELVHLVSSDW